MRVSCNLVRTFLFSVDSMHRSSSASKQQQQQFRLHFNNMSSLAMIVPRSEFGPRLEICAHGVIISTYIFVVCADGIENNKLDRNPTTSHRTQHADMAGSSSIVAASALAPKSTCANSAASNAAVEPITTALAAGLPDPSRASRRWPKARRSARVVPMTWSLQACRASADSPLSHESNEPKPLSAGEVGESIDPMVPMTASSSSSGLIASAAAVIAPPTPAKVLMQ